MDSAVELLGLIGSWTKPGAWTEICTLACITLCVEPNTLMCVTRNLSAGIEALNLAKWPIGGGQEQAIMASLGHHMWRLTQLDFADSLVSAMHCLACPVL